MSAKTLPSCRKPSTPCVPRRTASAWNMPKPCSRPDLCRCPSQKATTLPSHSHAAARRLNVDSVFRGSTSAYTLSYLQTALEKTKRQRQDYEFKGYALADKRKTIRRHGIELQRSSHCRLPVWCFSLSALRSERSSARVVWECRLSYRCFSSYSITS